MTIRSQIHPTGEQALHLFPVGRHRLVEGQFAEGFDKESRGSHVARHQGGFPHGLTRGPGQAGVDAIGVLNAILLELEAVGAEGAGKHHIGAGLTVGTVDVLGDGGVLQAPQLGAHACRQAPFLQQGPRGAVQNQYPLRQDLPDPSLAHPTSCIPAMAVTLFSGTSIFVAVSSTPRLASPSRS